MSADISFGDKSCERRAGNDVVELHALAAPGIIGVKGLLLLRPAVADLMDRSPDPHVLESIRRFASGVPGVMARSRSLRYAASA